MGCDKPNRCEWTCSKQVQWWIWMRLSSEHSEDDKPYLMATAYQYQYQEIGCQELYQITT